MTRESGPVMWLRVERRSGRNDPLASKSHEVTMTWEAPAASHVGAFSALMPPPSWRPPGHAARAARAGASLPLPSMMT